MYIAEEDGQLCTCSIGVFRITIACEEFAQSRLHDRTALHALLCAEHGRPLEKVADAVNEPIGTRNGRDLLYLEREVLC